MNTKTKLILFTALALLVIIPGSLSNIGMVYGYYNTFFDALYAVNEYVCLHEIAHEADVKNGWVSKSDEWKQAAAGYDLSQGYTELYANTYSDFMGHADAMPQELIRFYDFGMLHSLRIERCGGY